jgi:hypothetical protein
MVDNNLSEYFNSWILDARHKPIISMLEEIREKVIIKIQKQGSEGVKYGHWICPNILDKLKENWTETQNCHLEWNGKDGYEINHKVRTCQDKFKVYRHVVDMQNLKCSCRCWSLTGIPYSHPIIAMFHQGKEPEDFISLYYTKEMHQMTYSHVLKPLVGAHDWPRTGYDAPDPPLRKKMSGRPKKHQRREQGVTVSKSSTTKALKLGTVIKCKLCHQEGHNRSTCPTNKKVF